MVDAGVQAPQRWPKPEVSRPTPGRAYFGAAAGSAPRASAAAGRRAPPTRAPRRARGLGASRPLGQRAASARTARPGPVAGGAGGALLDVQLAGGQGSGVDQRRVGRHGQGRLGAGGGRGDGEPAEGAARRGEQHGGDQGGATFAWSRGAAWRGRAYRGGTSLRQGPGTGQAVRGQGDQTPVQGPVAQPGGPAAQAWTPSSPGTGGRVVTSTLYDGATGDQTGVVRPQLRRPDGSRSPATVGGQGRV
jgi:hypothetical protein